MNNKNKSKSKTMELGKVKSSEDGGKFFSFDGSIKEITLKVEKIVDGQPLVEVVKLEKNNKGYLNAFISTVDDFYGFKQENGWITPEEAQKKSSSLKEKGFSSIFQVKVTN